MPLFATSSSSKTTTLSPQHNQRNYQLTDCNIKMTNTHGIAQQRAFFMNRVLVSSCFHEETQFIIYQGGLLSERIGMRLRKNTSDIHMHVESKNLR